MVGGPTARKSSLQPRGSSITSSARFNDPRNFSDKAFMSNCIRTLIKYLTEHNYDHAISSKILTRPSSKDFNNIVVFLFKQVDPNLVLTGKFEDEVVAMFKHLGYPSQISKANISAAGTPHAWPSLLAALCWLIELLTYDEAAQEGQLQQAEDEMEEESGMSDKAFYSYLSTAYALFLSGEDAKYAELEEQFVNTFESKNVLLRDEIYSMEQRNVNVSNEIEEVQSRRALLPELEAKKKDYQKDLGKFQQLIEQLEKHKEQLDQKVRHSVFLYVCIYVFVYVCYVYTCVCSVHIGV